MSVALSSAKLRMPLLRPNLVARPRLVEKLDVGLRRRARLILVSAPAGFGKTTLLVEWLNSLSHASVDRSASGPKSAWISLDESDNDPVRFWTYLILALQSIHDEFAESALADLRSPKQLPVETIPVLLIEEMSYLPHRETPFVLVLEDYHVITNPLVHTTLAFLLEHLPLPQTVCVAMCTRADPPVRLARLRAQEELMEVRADDLRFSSDEATLFLRRCGGLKLSPEEIAILEERTEGWVAGLQMAALSVQGQSDTQRFVEGFSGAHHYILDYLVEQVLDRQPENVQRFLMETSILEQLSGPLCEAVTDQCGGQDILEKLERANLFLVPLDDERQWYRYHHLFRDLLYARLKQTHADALPRLHAYAAEWYERNGLFTEAITHFKAAEDFENAARLLEQNILPAILRGEINTVLAWVATLPQELVRRRPWLSIYYAWALAFAGQTERVESLLQEVEREMTSRAEGLADGTELESMLGQIASLRTYVALLSANVSVVSEQALQARKHLPECDLMTRSIITFVLADTYQMVGDLPSACETLSEVIQIAHTMDNLHLTITGMIELAYLCKVRGRLHQAHALYQEVMQMVDERGRPHFPMLGSVKVGIGDLLREWNDLPSAARWVTGGVEYNKRRGSPNFLVQSYLALGRVLLAQGDLQGAFDLLDKAAPLIQKFRVNPRAINTAKALRVRLWLARGELTNALRSIRESPTGGQDELSYMEEPYTLARSRVLLAQGKPDQALDLLIRLGEAAQEGDRVGSLIEILAIQALAWWSRNDLPRAITALEKGLLLAQPEGYVRLFVDEGAPMAELLQKLGAQIRLQASRSGGRTLEYIDQLLNALGSGELVAPPAVGPQPVIEPLSDRELEVLRLLAEGLSNREITQRLTVAIGTVKAHVHNIYGKLGVENRIQAIARARELGLL